MKIAVRPDLEWTLAVDLGRPPKASPTEVDLDTPYGSLRISAKTLSEGYEINGELQFKPGMVEAEDVDELREFLVAVERHLGRRLEAP